MAVITISRQFGSGGQALAETLAESLGYVFADSDIVTRIARAANVSGAYVEHMERETGGKFLWLISHLVSKSLVNKILGDERGYIDETIYLDYLVVLIAQLAEEGNVVIMGRGSQYILRDHPDAVHILIVDSLENRICKIMERHDLTRKKAARMVRDEDKRRIGLYKKIGKTDYDKAGAYDLSLNLGKIDADTALSMIFTLTRRKESLSSNRGGSVSD